MTQTHDTQQQDQVQDARQVQDGERTPEEQALQEYNAEMLTSHPGLREAFLVMLEAVPEPDEDASARIVGSILEADQVEDLDKPWDSDGMRDLCDRQVLVRAITKRPSDFQGGLGVYLGCECTLPDDGTNLFVTCGSVSSVAQLVRAHTLEALPLLVIPRMAKKATKNGYWPYHLEIVKGRMGTSARVATTAARQQAERGARAQERRAHILEEARVGIQADGAGERVG